MVDREFAGIPAISGTFNSEALALLQRDSDAMGVKCIEKDSLGVASGYTSTSCAQL
ncbi:hypothetical protein H0H93_011619 [Arthromyces matolae]|nr:hypothetical protein H0H93_011619 [Arthromyces matolae]